MSNELTYVNTLNIDVFYDKVQNKLMWRIDGKWYYPLTLTETKDHASRLEEAFRDK